MIELTGKEILELARFIGAADLTDDQDEDITYCLVSVSGGKDFIVNEYGEKEWFDHICYFSEYPEEGCIGLGEPIEPPKEVVMNWEKVYESIKETMEKIGEPLSDTQCAALAGSIAFYVELIKAGPIEPPKGGE